MAVNATSKLLSLTSRLKKANKSDLVLSYFCNLCCVGVAAATSILRDKLAAKQEQKVFNCSSPALPSQQQSEEQPKQQQPRKRCQSLHLGTQNKSQTKPFACNVNAKLNIRGLLMQYSWLLILNWDLILHYKCREHGG